MKKTPRAQSRKNNSWWWDSHISPQNSKWLSENLEGKDQLSMVVKLPDGVVLIYMVFLKTSDIHGDL
jgi:hypothetical protein